eukprot:Phypoly_transcript_12650.p1 GENE.Phypoly_transcript_12650~~Phypoly_transcript_12650.p1  ORF type:complete len:328 (+),score=60.69 Phypoly_transcript_12650:72-986(+)
MDEKPVATNRPRYRAGNKETAVKAYTINQESRYLIVKNVPALGNVEDLIKLFALYGTIEEYRLLDEEEAAQFTDIYWIRFADIAAARIAKRKCDDYNFIGNLLDVAYAPQFESISDMKNKLEERRRIVARKISQNYAENNNLRRKNDVQAERPAALEAHQLPFEAPPEHAPTQFELLPNPTYRSEKPQLYTQNSTRGTPAPAPGQQPPQQRAQHEQREDDIIRQPGNRTAGGGMVDTYAPDSSVNATVLSIRSKLTKLSDATPGMPSNYAPQPTAHQKYPSQIPEQGSYYQVPAAPTVTKRKRI